MTGFLYVCLGAAVGAPARYLVDRAVQKAHDTLMPWGTLTVNLVGSLMFGALVGLEAHLGLPAGLMFALGTGFCGTLTTYSTMSYETFRLVEDSAWLYALLNVVVSVMGGLLAAVLGYSLGSAI